MDRLVDVEWEQAANEMFLVTIEVISYDRTGLMADILAVLAGMKLSVPRQMSKCSRMEWL